LTFEIDPSTSFIKDENILLAKYLLSHFMIIEIYDAESRFLYGTIKIPLFDLLRQGKS